MSVQSLSIERINTPTGRMMIVVDGEQRLRALDWEDHEPRMQRLLRQHYGEINLREEARPTAVVHALEAYFKGDLVGLNSLPTATNGTDFQRTVWAALRHIVPGETISYGRLAARIGQPTAVRAVGLANGANPIAIVVPCHRVIGANGALTGFGGGVERKRWLLAHERASSRCEMSSSQNLRKFTMAAVSHLRDASLRNSQHLSGGVRDADAQGLCSSRHFLTAASVFSMCFSAWESE